MRERYARRHGDAQRYSLLNDAALSRAQERQRAHGRPVRSSSMVATLVAVRLLEVGCGTGSNLLDFLRLGLAPEHLAGRRASGASGRAGARECCRRRVRITLGDAAARRPRAAPASQDIVYQATVFSSLLDDGFQQQLADVMWKWVRPGGGILWYDFVIDNPRNPGRAWRPGEAHSPTVPGRPYSASASDARASNRANSGSHSPIVLRARERVPLASDARARLGGQVSVTVAQAGVVVPAHCPSGQDVSVRRQRRRDMTGFTDDSSDREAETKKARTAIILTLSSTSTPLARIRRPLVSGFRWGHAPC